MQPNRLLRRYDDINRMESFQKNQLLNVSSRRIRQPDKIDPKKIKELVLDQRKPDAKLEKGKFERIFNNLEQTHNPEKEKYWATRTNIPYKNILPASEFKKEYKTEKDLIIYTVKKEDKDSKIFDEKSIQLKKQLGQHDKELKDIYTSSKENEFKKDFEYNNLEKYKVKYDPTEFSGMKGDIIEFYKKEQLEEETKKKCIGDLIVELEGLDSDESVVKEERVDNKQTEQFEESIVEKVTEKKQEKDNKLDKYKQRQKKL